MATESDIKNDFGKKWLGNIVRKAGFDYDEVDCRGRIVKMGIIEETEDKANAWFSISTESAWRPMLEMWHLILGKYAPSCKYIYVAEEPGTDLFWTNDMYGEFFNEHFVIDFYDGEEDKRKKLNIEWGNNYFTEDELKDWGAKTFKLKNPTIEEIKTAFDEYVEENDDIGMCWNEFEYVSDWEIE